MRSTKFRIGRLSEGFEVLRTLPENPSDLLADSVIHYPSYVPACSDVSVGFILSNSVRKVPLIINNSDVVREGDRKIGFPGEDATYESSSSSWILTGNAESFEIKYNSKSDLESALNTLLDGRYPSLSFESEVAVLSKFIVDGYDYTLQQKFAITPSTKTADIIQMTGLVGTLLSNYIANLILQYQQLVHSTESITSKERNQYDDICTKIEKGSASTRKVFNLPWNVFKVIANDCIITGGENSRLLLLGLASLLTSGVYEGKFVPYAQNDFKEVDAD